MPGPIATVIFALLTAFWAGTSAVLTGMKLLAERRDAVVTGKLGSADINVQVRRRILRSDWVPLRLALGLVSAMLAVIIAALPQFVSPPVAILQFICWVAAVVPLSGAAYFILYGASEYLYLERLLNEMSPQYQRGAVDQAQTAPANTPLQQTSGEKSE